MTLSTLRTTVHVGAHADAPSHYGAEAPTIDQRPLEPYLGPCQVVRLEIPRGRRFGEANVPVPVTDPRVLFRTDTFDPHAFNEDFAALSVELVERLHGGGTRLVGIDTPSVDLFDSKDLPAHRACLARDIALLAGLVLAGVLEGEYELVALALRLVGFDASPVRAILRPLR